MTAHPAPFSRELIPQLIRCLEGEVGLLLDPFAGTGRAAEIAEAVGMTFVGFEIEPEWAALHPAVQCVDSTRMPLGAASVDAIVTSPAYGNRMADSYAGSPKDMEEQERTGKIRRRTYRIALGRELSPNNGAGMQWGADYKRLHEQVWGECYRVLKPGRKLVLNVSDHERKGRTVPVTHWHIETLRCIGFRTVAMDRVPTRRYRDGANSDRRVPHENIITFVKETP